MDQLGAFLPLILIFGVFYILLIRPQQKKVKMHREMLNNLKKGDKIITSGGIIGKITKVSETRELNVEISDEVEVKVSPGMVTDLYSPPTTKVNQETKTENKPGLLSGFFGNKK